MNKQKAFKFDPDSLPNSGIERIKRFIKYLKNYVSLAPLIAAALPIPITQLKIIPVYEAQKNLLTASSTIFCFLTLSIIFSKRHSFAEIFFSKEENTAKNTVTTWLIILILIAFLSLFLYVSCFYNSIEKTILLDTAKSSIDSLQVTIKMERDIILNTGSLSIPSSNWLIFWYNIFFISVELCFILLALKEYLQDFLGIEDKALIDLGIKTHSIGFWFANLEWNVDFNKGKDKDWTCILSGPYCSVCGYLLKYIGQDNKGVSIWECYNKHQAYIEVEPARLKQLAGDYAWKFKPEKTYSETEVNEMITRALNKFKSELRKKERTIKKDGS